MWYNLIQFIFKFIEDAGAFANWLFTPLEYRFQSGLIFEGHFLPPVLLSVTPIQFLSISMIGLILAVHLVKLFDPFGG